MFSRQQQTYKKDFWKDKVKEITKEKLEQEKKLLLQRKISNTTKKTTPIFSEIKKRNVMVSYQKFGEYTPRRCFFFQLEGKKIFGEKLLPLSCLDDDSAVLFKFNNQLRSCMLLGIVEREQVSQDGTVVFYRPFIDTEKLGIFDILKADRMIDIYYPYPQLHLENKLEKSTPDDGWVLDKDRVKFLSTGESETRQATIDILSKFNLDGKKIYDPACSTGEFLKNIKDNFPGVHTIGQDLSSEMVDYAKDKVDEIYVGDSLHSPLAEESVDFIFYRFLNAEVVTTRQAYLLFVEISRKCKKGGYLIIFGYTPVLIASQWLEMLGFQILQRNYYFQQEDTVFQYYVLRKVESIDKFGYREKDLIFS